MKPLPTITGDAFEQTLASAATCLGGQNGPLANDTDALQHAENQASAVLSRQERAGEKAPGLRVIDPYQIYFKRRALYLDAYSPKADRNRLFGLTGSTYLYPRT